MLRGYTRGLLAVARRWGGPVYGAFDDDDELVGAVIAFEEGHYPPPPQSMLFEARGKTGHVRRGHDDLLQ